MFAFSLELREQSWIRLGFPGLRITRDATVRVWMSTAAATAAAGVTRWAGWTGRTRWSGWSGWAGWIRVRIRRASTTTGGAAAAAGESPTVWKTAATAHATWVFLREIATEIAIIDRFWVPVTVGRFGLKSRRWMAWCGIVAIVSRIRRVVFGWETVCHSLVCLHWDGNTKLDETHHFCPECQSPLRGIHTS